MKSYKNAVQIEKFLIAGALVERLFVDCLSVVISLLIPYVLALFCSALVPIHVV